MMGLLRYVTKRSRNLYNKVYTAFVRHRFRVLKSYIDYRVEFTNPEFISIGERVHFRPYSWIYAIYNDREQKGIFSPNLEISDECSIGRFCHITCTTRVVLEKGVLLGEGILIADNSHSYSDITIPVRYQPVISSGPLIIGSGTWVGNGARIMGKVTVGQHCVVGTNAVVTKDVPDYSVVVGIPARVIKQYSFEERRWVSVDREK